LNIFFVGKERRVRPLRSINKLLKKNKLKIILVLLFVKFIKVFEKRAIQKNLIQKGEFYPC